MTQSTAQDSSQTSCSPLNIVFAGTPEFAARHLEHLLNSKHNILAVYTQPDRPAGRGKKLSASPVKQLAEKNKLDVLQPKSLKDSQAQEAFTQLNCDVLIVVAYGLILPEAILNTPKFGCINVHASLLPRWRGAAPIQRAIEAGDSHTGVTIMQMNVGLDTGDMLLKVECNIDENENAGQLHDKLCLIGPPALIKALDHISNGSLKPEKQDDSLSTYAKKIEKSEAIIDWHEDLDTILLKIRAFNPFPICFGQINNERIRIHEAERADDSEKLKPGEILLKSNAIHVGCNNGSLSIKKIQLPGKKALAIHDFLNGSPGLLEDSHFDTCPNTNSVNNKNIQAES